MKRNLIDILQSDGNITSTTISSINSCANQNNNYKKIALSKNAKKIEKAILHFFNNYNGSHYQDPLEELILKKYKFHDDLYVTRPSVLIGYVKNKLFPHFLFFFYPYQKFSRNTLISGNWRNTG